MSHFMECLGPFAGRKQTFQPSFEEAIQLSCCWFVCYRMSVPVGLCVAWVSARAWLAYVCLCVSLMAISVCVRV